MAPKRSQRLWLGLPHSWACVGLSVMHGIFPIIGESYAPHTAALYSVYLKKARACGPDAGVSKLPSDLPIQILKWIFIRKILLIDIFLTFLSCCRWSPEGLGWTRQRCLGYERSCWPPTCQFTGIRQRFCM